jgi:hypothetical protein
MSDINLDISEIEKLAIEAFQEENRRLGEQFQERVPVRSGKLKGSYQLTFPTPTEAIHEWTAPYAVYVYEDITTKSGETRTGARWAEEGLNEYPENFNNNLDSRL